MEPRRKEIVRVIRDSAESWWLDFPAEFRHADHSVNFPRIKAYMMATCAVINSGIAKEDKPIARHFEAMEQAEKQKLLDEAFEIYRAEPRATLDGKQGTS